MFYIQMKHKEKFDMKNIQIKFLDQNSSIAYPPGFLDPHLRSEIWDLRSKVMLQEVWTLIRRTPPPSPFLDSQLPSEIF